MRANCPICGLAPIDTITMDYAIPDGWTLPTHYAWHLCNCGFIWADTEATADDFEQYYREHYRPTIDAHDIHRQKQIAAYIFEHIRADARVVDFGGGDSYITRQLLEYGFKEVTCVNLDDNLPDCDVVVMSQVIEHLYDLDKNMRYIDSRLADNGIIIIETPDAYSYSFRASPPMIDYYPTHINHFMPQTLISYMSANGYLNLDMIKGIEYKPTNAPMMRGIFQKGGMIAIFEIIRKRLADITPLGIDEKVIVYGLGDLAMHQIAQSGLNIAYFVDENPIYKGARINGIKIKDHIDTDHTVLVIGTRQKEQILAKLEGHKVITI